MSKSLGNIVDPIDVANEYTVDSFRYFIKLRKYTEPPEPPSSGLFDMGILDDAMNLVDKAMNAIDALGSIPDFGDPTTPLRDALKGVEAATSDMDGIANDLKNLFGE